MDHSRIVPILLAFEMHHFDFAIYISTNVYHVVDCNVLLVEMLANKADNKQKKQIIIIDIHIFIRKPTSLVASIPLGTKTIQFSRLQLQLKATEYIYIYIGWACGHSIVYYACNAKPTGNQHFQK